jgi:hypothetical protein
LDNLAVEADFGNMIELNFVLAVQDLVEQELILEQLLLVLLPWPPELASLQHWLLVKVVEVKVSLGLRSL